MRCSNHPDREAIAVCRCCLKGLCVECGEPLSRGLACRGACVEWAREYEALLEESLRNFRRRRQQQAEVEELKKKAAETVAVSGPPTMARPPGPTIRERAEAYRAATVHNPAPARPPVPWNNGAFHLIAGVVLVIWGVVEMEDYFFLLILGLVFVGYGLYRLGITRGRKSADAAATRTGRGSG